MSVAESVYRFIMRWPISALVVLVVFAVSTPLAASGPETKKPDWCSPLFEKLTDEDLRRMKKVAQSVSFLWRLLYCALYFLEGIRTLKNGKAQTRLAQCIGTIVFKYFFTKN